jgi:hypothetical protein
MQADIRDATSYNDTRDLLEGNCHSIGHLVAFCRYEENCVMSDGGYSPWDPIFYLHHTMIDYLYALWQVCHGHDNLGAPASVSRNVYSPSLGFLGWNSAMDFSGLQNTDWAFASRNNNIRPRDVHDAPAWGVTYDAGPFGNRRVWLQTCQLRQLNASWFRVTPSGSDRVFGDFVPGVAGTSGSILNDTDPVIATLNEEFETEAISVSQFSHMYAQHSCETSHHRCRRPAWDYEKCHGETLTADTELEYFLNKPGVDNSTCLQDIRRNQYAYIQGSTFLSDEAKVEKLTDLCNGAYDPKC